MVKKYVKVKGKIDVTCEACNNNYTYNRSFKMELPLFETTSYSSCIAAAQECLEEDPGSKKCPKCKYLQSWQQIKWTDKWGARLGTPVGVISAFVLGGLLVYIVQLIFEHYNISLENPWPGILALGGFFLGLGFLALNCYVWSSIFSKLFRPNRTWYRKNGYKEFNKIEPKFSVSIKE